MTGNTAGWINETIFDHQLPKDIFYIHTAKKSQMTAPTVHAIISAMGSLFQPVAKYLDHYLQPLVQGMDSYVRDTKHLLIMLKDLRVPPDTFLVTMYVSSLYTVIPHDLGVAVCRTALQKNHCGSTPVEFLVSLLDLILSHNYFMFQDALYLQLAGTAMGSNVAPSFANLFMKQYDRQRLLPMGGSHILFYKCYIDDLLLFWNGTEDELISLGEALNYLDSPIK